MSNDERKFGEYVDSVRFDDAPDAAHRDLLEKKLLDAWETEQEYDGYEEPVAVYFRKLAIAAGFLIAAGVLFWAIDAAFISRNPVADLPDQPGIQAIIEQENVSGVEKKKLLTQIRDVGTLIEQEDTDGLVAVLKTSDVAYTVRTWAAKWLGRFGNENTLAAIEAKIQSMQISDPQHPLMMAAETIRERLGLSEPNMPSEPSTLEGKENCEPGVE